jgi:hypothetical protein
MYMEMHEASERRKRRDRQYLEWPLLLNIEVTLEVCLSHVTFGHESLHAARNRGGRDPQSPRKPAQARASPRKPAQARASPRKPAQARA